MEDRQRATRAADGDEAAFELIVTRHTEAVWRLACLLLGVPSDAEEVVQDTFLRAHRNLGRFRAEASLETWLLVICRHASLDRLRRRRNAPVSLDAVRGHGSAGIDPSLRLSLVAAMAALGAAEREAFQLVDVLGYSREEAARIVEVPASTMRSRCARARRQLMEAIDGGPEEVGRTTP